MTTAYHTVHVRVNDAATRLPTPVRIRFLTSAGQYLAPFGRVTHPATGDNEDVGGNLVLGADRFAYIDGTCEIRLPTEPVTVEVLKGFEYAPVRQTVEVGSGKLTLRLAIGRWTDQRADDWYSGDSRAHFLSPHAALLEGAAEDLAVVNLLALECQSGDRIAVPGILAFSGQYTALEAAGHLVAVNTLNQHPLLGSLALLHCHRVVYPLRFGDRNGLDDWSLADWCDQCHRKRGLVVWTNADASREQESGALSEALADAVLGKVDTLEATSLQPPIIDLWYRLLNTGIQIPLVGGSGKTSNCQALGGVRTYARMKAGEEFSLRSWIEAVRAGRTVVTNGPLISFTVDEADPGSRIELAAPGSLQITATATGAWPLDRLEIVANGEVVAEIESAGRAFSTILETELQLPEGGWIAARCQGSTPLHDYAHTSPVYVCTDGKPPPVDGEAVAALARDLEKTASWIEHKARCANAGQREHCYRSCRKRSTRWLRGGNKLSSFVRISFYCHWRGPASYNSQESTSRSLPA